MSKVETKTERKNTTIRTKKADELKIIRIPPMSTYEKLERTNKRLTKQNADLKLLHKEMKKQDRDLKAFVHNYLRPKYKPRLTADGEGEEWRTDGHKYSTLTADTLEPTNVKFRFCGGMVASLEKPLDNKTMLRLMKLSEKIAGKPFSLTIGDRITDNIDGPDYSLYG